MANANDLDLVRPDPVEHFVAVANDEYDAKSRPVGG
jgi:hypothetical protein